MRKHAVVLLVACQLKTWRVDHDKLALVFILPYRHHCLSELRASFSSKQKSRNQGRYIFPTRRCRYLKLHRLPLFSKLPIDSSSYFVVFSTCITIEKGHKKEGYCVCGGPGTGVMILCGACNGWFHATCMVSSTFMYTARNCHWFVI